MANRRRTRSYYSPGKGHGAKRSGITFLAARFWSALILVLSACEEREITLWKPISHCGGGREKFEMEIIVWNIEFMNCKVCRDNTYQIHVRLAEFLAQQRDSFADDRFAIPTCSPSAKLARLPCKVQTSLNFVGRMNSSTP